jgi:uncharacterized membrane protein YgdD (TMEM256/DUF423 family)
MPTSARLWLVVGTLACLVAVILGAFGAHALRAKLAPELIAAYNTAVQYHFWHALGLLIVGILALLMPGAVAVKWAGWLMLAGIILFSGSLYLLAVTGSRALGAITPLGGVAFIAAWVLLAYAIWQAA